MAGIVGTIVAAKRYPIFPNMPSRLNGEGERIGHQSSNPATSQDASMANDPSCESIAPSTIAGKWVVTTIRL